MDAPWKCTPNCFSIVPSPSDSYIRVAHLLSLPRFQDLTGNGRLFSVNTCGRIMGVGYTRVVRWLWTRELSG